MNELNNEKLQMLLSDTFLGLFMTLAQGDHGTITMGKYNNDYITCVIIII